MRLLVVEDDEILKDGLQVGLTLKGFVVDAVMTYAEAEAVLRAASYDAVVLDLILPDGSGIDLLKELRARRDHVPVLLLTARDSVQERIAGLDTGADDYLGKPFDLNEVAARLRALVRRAAGRSTAVVEWAGISLDPARFTVEKDGSEIRLSRREFSVLHALMNRPGAVLSKSQIEEKLYGWQEDVESNTVEVHIHHLRTKLGTGLIETVRGLGYRMGERS
ncbi:response regulator [Mesorhizobium sp. B2-3-5]|uniref:response regulator n=1 Tax=Mesorhizobium sp. B2-3-5 TaxID=2589958 RepID=UPI00112EBC30|nr:response regulator [Mesorhizobium sp. B2-3-5]TPM26925.1 response regulator [Mesorhizobium sp. B2-3-5]